MKKTKSINRENIKTKNMNPKIYLAIAIFLIALTCIPGIASAMTHPCLLFENISETPGYQYNTTSPWSSWEASIISSADNALDKDFSDPNWPTHNNIRYRASYARDLALAYQITKNTAYAEKAKEALLNLDVGDVRTGPLSGKLDRYTATRHYSLAYDWTQHYLESASDETVRDKLALLADDVYYDLNDGGTNMDHIAFADHHSQAYPIMGIAGCVLYDYENASLNSTPSDWIKVGTEYLFENDSLHSYPNRSLLSWAFNDDGKYFTGSYKNYFLDEFLLWSQVYSHFFNSNIFEDYPIMKRIQTSELWESLPNRYHNNYGTSGNTKYAYHRGIMSLLDDENKSYMLKHDDIIEASTLLPHSSFSAPGPTGSDLIRLLYLTYEDYTSIERKYPAWTSHLDSDTTKSFFQVFRDSWENDSDWLSLITWNINTIGNRDMGHHDQLSFEYYSKGDLLLSDAGEPKHIYDYSIPSPYLHYGEDGVFHNTIMIEDPRNPFDVSDFTNSRSRVFFKGLSKNLVTPAKVENLIETTWMELLEGKVDITTVTGADRAIKQSLTSPIDYGRTILFPNKDYFIIVDRLEGSEPWIYRNVFRPSSLSVTPSTDRYLEDVGHVNGNLTIGNTPYDWLSLPYKSETDAGTTTNSIKWNTTNPYGNDVELHLFSSPSSEIKVTKHITRIGSYNTPSEVFLPLVYFRAGEAVNDLYRVTVLLPKYTTETEKTPEEVPVAGNGNAVKVTTSTYEDFIYTGKGESSFEGLTTDADILHFRKSDTQPTTLTLLRGSYVDVEGARKIDVSKQVDYLTVKYDGDSRTVNVKGTGTDVKITLYPMNPSITYQVKKDGLTYTNLERTDNNTKMVITTDLSEHTFEIESTTSDTTSPVITNVDTKDITSSSATVTWQTDEAADSVIKYGTSQGNYVFEKCDTACVLSHSITLTNLSADTPYYFVVNSTDYSGNSDQSDEYNFATTFKGTPETTYVITPSPDDNGWLNTSATVTFFRNSGVDIAYTNYSMYSGTGPWTTVSTSTAVGPDAEDVTDITEDDFNVTVSDEGVTEIWFYSVDSNSNFEQPTKKITVKIKTGKIVGEWRFDDETGEFAEDTSGNTNTGTLTNMDSVTAWVARKSGTALQFDGIDDYVDCGNDASLDITDAITIELWLNPNVAGEGGPNAGPVAKAETGVDASWQLRYNAPGDYMGFQFNGDPEGSTWVSVNQNLTPGEWYHIAGTFDGTTIRCYLNGLETDTNLLSAIKSGNATLFIGQDGWGNIFNGAIDEVKIYNRALTVEEVRADYEAGLEEVNSLSGTVTSLNSTGLAGANVSLATVEGTEINTTQTDSTGTYTFTDIAPGDNYNLTVTKPRFWPANNITVTTANTEDIILCQKGDWNTNSEQADAGDLAMMADATVNTTLRDWTYDLNNNGVQADEDDLRLLKNVSVGVAELE
jgi:hypothetical protein